jgi:subfamily B ATP-binding cassette protein MsbA
MNTFRRLLAFSRPFRSYVPEYAIQAILAVIFGLINFSLLVPLLNVLFGNVKPPSVLVKPVFHWNVQYLIEAFNYQTYLLIRENGEKSALLFVCSIILIFIALNNFFRYSSQRVLTRMRVNLLRNIRNTLFSKFMELPAGFMTNNRKGNLISIMSNDVTEVEMSVVSAIQVIFREPLMIVGYFIFMFYLSVHLTLFSIFFIPVTGFLINLISRSLRKKAHNSQMLLGNLLNITEEGISGLKIIRLFNASHFVENMFRSENQQYRNTLKSIVNKRELASPVSEFLGVLSAVVLILYGGSLVLNKDAGLDASGFITYILIFSQILQPVKNISTAYANLQKGLAAGERIFEILDHENPITEKPDAKAIGGLQESIRFEGVSFSYNETKVLDNFSVDIPRGSTLALVGPSGAGKSTIIDLLARFYDVKEGRILLDGTDIRDLKIYDLRNLIGMVNQDTFLFNDTIFSNIAFGLTDATREDVERAAKMAFAHDFIMETENGYNTTIGDRGSKLSGGQRQRISIARAILRNPQIMILDEATSALDTEAEKIVQDALANLMKDRTSIVIAHRLSTIQHADKILVLDKGRIAESGTHQELLAAGGLYRKLVELQKVGGDYLEE